MKEEIRIPWPDWKVMRIIGRGASGTVYEIRKEQFGITEAAALKVIHVPMEPDEIDERLESGIDEQTVSAYYEKCVRDIVREYSIMLELRGNANIVFCDEVRYEKQENGIGWDVFIKMELLQSLNKMPARDYREEDVIHVAEDLCSGLIQCRKHSIIHRDIKPQNIFCSRDGVYKLGDFGISTIAENTATGTKTGTYEYMAPEVYKSQPYNATVDIYAVGLVMYWMMNNHCLPFLPMEEIPTYNEKKAANDRRFAGDRFPDPVNGSPWLQAIMRKASAYRPEERYATAQDMLADLKRRAAPKSDPDSIVGPGSRTETVPEMNPVPPAGSGDGAGQNRKANLDLEAELTCEVRDLRETRTVSVEAGGRQIRFRIPAGTTDGQRICMAGLGNKDSETGRTGDLYVTVHAEHKKRISWGMLLLAAVSLVCVGLLIYSFLGKDRTEQVRKEEVPVTVQTLPPAPVTVQTLPPAAQPTVKPVETVPPTVTAPPATEPPRRAVHVGDTITMGTYPQMSTDDYDTPIEWMVLEVSGDQALVISRYGLDSQKYHSRQEDVTWETCTLRTWLNGMFYRTAFNSEEQSRIVESTVYADENSLYDSYAGGDTQDKIFALSLSETEEYLDSDSKRICMPTPFAIAQNAFVSSREGCSWWLTRTPGETGEMVVSVDPDGSIDYDGGKVSSSRGVVRPAMWIRID